MVCLETACWRKEKVLLWRVELGRGPRKGSVASATEALLSPGDNPWKWMELFGEAGGGGLPILENAGCGASGPRPQMLGLPGLELCSPDCNITCYRQVSLFWASVSPTKGKKGERPLGSPCRLFCSQSSWHNKWLRVVWTAPFTVTPLR